MLVKQAHLHQLMVDVSELAKPNQHAGNLHALELDTALCSSTAGSPTWRAPGCAMTALIRPKKQIADEGVGVSVQNTRLVDRACVGCEAYPVSVMEDWTISKVWCQSTC